MIVGVRGPGVLLSARTCAWLEQYAALASRRTMTRGIEPQIFKQLDEIRQAAEEWRRMVAGETAERLGSAIGSDDGTERARSAEPDAPSSWLSTSQVGDLLRVTPRAVVKAIARGELDATRVGRSWRITPEAVEHYRQATSGRTNR